MSISNSNGHPYLTWSAPTLAGSAPIDRYDIYRDLGAGFSYIGNNTHTNYLDSGIDYDRFGSNTAYYYVIAVNEDEYESLPSNTGCGTNLAEKRLADNPTQDQQSKIIVKYELKPNYPNPFNSSTTIEFYLSETTFLSLKIFDISGREIRQLIYEQVSAGNHQIIWDGKDDNGKEVSSGIFICKIITKDFSQSQKMIMVK